MTGADHSQQRGISSCRKSPQREQILGYQIFSGTCEDCIDGIADAIGAGNKTWLACLNPHSYAIAADRATFMAALRAANWLIPDGVGVVLASRLLRGHIANRITGWDIFCKVNATLDRACGSVFLLGSTEANLLEMQRQFAKDWPHVRVAGVLSPPFSEWFSADEISRMIATINCARPDVLWVAMTAPKQEEWIHANLDELDVKFVGAIGAVFDFYTGRIRRSHPVFRRLGLEWLPRLLREPRRLWRRTFVSAPIFVWHLIRARCKAE